MKQPWIYNVWIDSLFILGIPFFITALILLLPASFRAPDSMTVVSWALLVVAVDVSHVYSTLYRTYLDKETRNQHSVFLYIMPFFVFVGCFILYSLGAMVFWRVVAYLAVYHFTRQQYGFLRIYSRSENASAWARRIDALTIYSAALYPILDWHLSGQKSFNWFMQGDFYYFASSTAKAWALGAYLSVLGIYVVKEILQLWKNRTIAMEKQSYPLLFNIPRNTIILGTIISWYIGIVYLNSDLAFTAINVVSHGIPYMALVWIWGRKKYENIVNNEMGKEKTPESTTTKTAYHAQSAWAFIFRPRYVLLFIAFLFLLGYIEEGFWNIWVWHEKEHVAFFSFFHKLSGNTIYGNDWLKFAVPLLSVPQITHYIIDGFIWKIRKDKYAWQVTLSSTKEVK
ncbi:MAG TPA: hypothetical protein PLY93_02665 [Turneriella sp.]|nr:hypothetical protein [Turneriella sp.]